MLHSRPTLVSKPLIPHLPIYISSPSAPSPTSLAPGCPSALPSSSPPDFLRVLQWNAGGLRARSTKLLQFLSSHPVDLICIQKSNLNSSSSFRIPGFSALRSNRTHSRSGILSSDAKHASSVVIFIRHGLSFSELSTSSLSSLDPYSNYVGVNISFNNPSPLSFLNVHAPPFRSSLMDDRTDSFSPSILPSSRNLFILGDFNCRHPHWDSRGTSDPRGEEVFDWVISSDLLSLNDPDTPTLLHRSVPQGSVLGTVLFSLFINDLPASLPSSVSCSLYADDLAIWPSSPSVPIAVEASQRALLRLERWSEYWCLSLNPSKCEASSVDPHQANLQRNFLLLGSRLRFKPFPTFLGVTFDRTLSFSKHVSSLKAKVFPRLKALRCISASSGGPSKESLYLLYKSFLRPLLTYASPGWFSFLSATNITKLERLHRAASRAITESLSSSPIPLLLSEASLPLLRVTLTHFTLLSYERALRLPASFPISGLARLGVKPRLCRSS